MENNQITEGCPAGVRLKIVSQGKTPVCVETGRIMCRGCPGWPFMKSALLDDKSGWSEYPIHCPCTGLTMMREC